jgi:glycosyltransferase involved in cell wall biosynthesis
MKHSGIKRVLFVSYLFPPTGGVGVHRVSKFVKYLPEFGWNSSVLTVSNASVPLHDESLVRDIPAGTLIRRARTYEPGYAVKAAVSGGQAAGRGLRQIAKGLLRRAANTALQPDSQILWHPQAWRTGVKLLKDVPHQAIIATGPPFSSFLLGARLSRKFGLPLILDYRDEWTISNAYWENKGQGWLARAVQHRQQAHVLRAARAILATTPGSAAEIGRLAREVGSQASTYFIYNGFDPDDYPAFTGGPRETAGRRFRLAFIGTLWNLNSIEPVVQALLQLSSRAPQLAAELELLVAGRRTAEQEQLLDQLNGTPIQVTRQPFVSHDEAIRLMQSADSLLMLNSDLPQTQRIINAKTFEYMAARRPMFVVAPPGDVWNIVQDLPGTVLCPPGDVGQIAEKLLMQLEMFRCQGDWTAGAYWNIARFERRHLAGELADLLNRVLLPGLILHVPEERHFPSTEETGCPE